MPRGKKAITYQRENAILSWTEAHHPVTIRGIFYKMSSLDLVEKTESGYRTVQGLCKSLRQERRLDFSWISDNTRWMRRPTTYNSLQDCLLDAGRYYRKSLWNTQNQYCEIWCEKDALTGTIYPVIEKWDVPLMVSRGYASL